MIYEKLKALSAEAFKRCSGVKPKTFAAMLELLREAERNKKLGRSSKRSLEEQLTLTLSYRREYRTQFHMAASYKMYTSTAKRILTKVEDVLICPDRFSLPERQTAQAAEHGLVVVVVDGTETHGTETPTKEPNELGRRLPSQKSKSTTTAARSATL